MDDSRPDDERRFDEAFRGAWPAVFRFATAWTNDLPSAEDIAQEAFTRLMDARRTEWHLEPPKAVRGESPG
jgi:DNA-directed RNA polymerase specialized sigma24 family protein